MKPVALVSATLAMLGASLPARQAQADAAQTLRKIVVDVEVPLAIPLSAPLRDRFGVGVMPSLSAAYPVGRWALLGLRLRGGLLTNGSVPDPSIHDPDMGGLVSLSGIVRFRPLAGRVLSYAAGPWIEAGAGPGVTGSLLRASFEAGAGWNFRLGRWLFGPVARYLQVVETSNALDSSDAKLALIGIEVVLHDAQRTVPRVAPPPPPPPPKPVEVGDRDKDGIPDDVDQCPDDPEDKDGFEDGDGCPDTDNDKDSIPDKTDACPNEPETVNGVEDQDGCPDTAPIVVKENRILLTEHVLFDSNRARVRTAGRPALEAVLTLWKQHPEWDHLTIEGHADRHGPDRFNDWLSNERAVRARRVLVDIGFPPDKIVVAGLGKRQPRVQGNSAEADRENRRVEFVIIKKVEEQPAAPDPTQPPAPESANVGGLQP